MKKQTLVLLSVLAGLNFSAMAQSITDSREKVMQELTAHLLLDNRDNASKFVEKGCVDQGYNKWCREDYEFVMGAYALLADKHQEGIKNGTVSPEDIRGGLKSIARSSTFLTELDAKNPGIDLDDHKRKGFGERTEANYSVIFSDKVLDIMSGISSQ